MKEIMIIGAGGHAKVIIDIILQRKKNLNDNLVIKGILDDSFNENEKKDLFGIPIIGKVNKILELPSNIYYIIAIGNNDIRKKISQNYKEIKYITLIHPKAIVAENVSLDEGTVLMAGSIVNSDTKIGKHCIINTGSIVEHDNIIKDYVHISPGATLCGGVIIEEETWVGARSTIIQGIRIGKKVIIGAGSVTIKDIDSFSTVIGIPAKNIKIN
ncbi:acetyltransferase [Cetobacterium somerae]|uniref:acetyltransferase n=1 Tax=Cetobacterium somerae TaxID=188913 RepID=UPI0038926283